MKMKAVVYTRYGSPDVLELKEVDKPVPATNEVLVKVCASSVNVEDLDYLTGRSWAVRVIGPFKPKYNILGFDVAGRVESVGSNVTEFQPGDEVMGDLFNQGFGAFAEYLCAPEKALVPKFEGISFKEAAAMPSRSILALQGLCGKRPLQKEQKVLINGAGGGVGPFAVQIAKSFGAEVTAVDSTQKLNMLRSIGADHVIDYTKEDFTKNGECYDQILDIVGRRSIFRVRRSLAPDGIYSMVGGSRVSIFQALFFGPLLSLAGNKKTGIIAWKPNKKEDLAVIKELVEAKKVVPVIDRIYPLNKTAEALRYFDEGQPQGKIVITVSE